MSADRTPQATEDDSPESADTGQELSPFEALTAERNRLEADKADLTDRFMRAQAEFQNSRRRAEKERAEFAEYASMEAVRTLLPILDDFERALQVESADPEYAKGMELIEQRFAAALQKLGLEPIESQGKMFDPHVHHAVEMVETNEAPDQTILAEFQRGYNFKGRLLRAAMVKVAVRAQGRRMSVTKRDYYEILGVTRDANEGALKSAYRKLALQHHPDRNPGDHQAEEKFKEAAEAYSVLSDGQKRAAYDRFGHQGVAGASGNGGFDASGFPDLSDILNDMFGGGFEGFGGRQQRTRAQRGEDLRFDLEISFEDSMRGTTVDVQIPKMEECGRCKGKGAEPDDGLVSCPTCRGRGEVIYQQAFLQVRRTCNQCAGRGQIIRRPCKECRGEGYLKREKKLKVSIPAGVDNGTQMRLSQEGQPGGNGGPPGDLYVVMRVTEHPIFERHEYDLHCSLPLNIAQAALGDSVDLMTFDGMQTVKIPEGSQPGARLRMKGLGVPHVNSGARGDLFVHLAVKVPTKLTREQRRLMDELRGMLPAENEPEEKSLLDKVKDYFM